MRGSITLTSTPTVGSTATLTLPLKVSSWAGNPQIARSLSEAQRLARSHPRSSTQRDTLNQEISNLVTPECNSPRPDHLQGLPIEPEGSSNALTPDQRSRIHVLLVEDKYISQSLPIRTPENSQCKFMTSQQCNKPENSLENNPEAWLPRYCCLEWSWSSRLPLRVFWRRVQ